MFWRNGPSAPSSDFSKLIVSQDFDGKFLRILITLDQTYLLKLITVRHIHGNKWDYKVFRSSKELAQVIYLEGGGVVICSCMTPGSLKKVIHRNFTAKSVGVLLKKLLSLRVKQTGLYRQISDSDSILRSASTELEIGPEWETPKSEHDGKCLQLDSEWEPIAAEYPQNDLHIISYLRLNCH